MATPVGIEVLRDARKGTKVQLIVRQKPYAMGSNIGTSHAGGRRDDHRAGDR